jgi:N-acyl homoserine lactone hydrolase
MPQWEASVERIRTIADETGARVVFGHDSEQLATLRTSPKEFYS